ncbi:preprotein translocase subunit YajC [Duncaniella muris]|uniref:preprotein translocase subunit YajC n=1 Tax=Duncaniella muris TaxID=2094150 RepID=UPI0025B65D1F|nr:preprotein translocase subunit YajC [Duncaniella muris]
MLNTILLQSMNSSWANILMIVALIAVFYFMMLRPQQKRQNEIKKFREGLKVGDAVVTAGGIYGKVKGIDDTTFTIEIARDVRITVDKGSVYPSAQQAANDAAEKGK